MATPLQSRCEFPGCDKFENLQACEYCQYVFYCSREHRRSHLFQHKELCTELTTACSRYRAEYRKLKRFSGNRKCPGYPFKNAIGRFTEFHETQDYRNAKRTVVEVLLKAGTKEALEACVEHGLEMHRLCWNGASVWLRNQTPLFMIMLGRDQDAYDFSKWLFMDDEDRDIYSKDAIHYSRQDLEDLVPFNLVNGKLDSEIWESVQDPFEPLDFIRKRIPNEYYCLSMILVKIMLLQDMKDLENMRVLEKLPVLQKNRDIFDLIQDQIPSTEVFRRDTALRTLDKEDFDDLRDLLDQHINRLFVIIGGDRFHFWTAMLKRGGPEYRSSDEAWYKMFDKLPGATQVIQSRLEMARQGDQRLLRFCDCSFQKYQRGEISKGFVSCNAERCFFGRKIESYWVG
ncbi:hypothetical protein TWF730_003229 [Orbilia blumenaviensis]|uniref:MYND-type domain-containing protein n=1 Tax=Orbilia blumenaviensis TaxID=1796055 RepID=A0AAV9U4N8_9PEZI